MSRVWSPTPVEEGVGTNCYRRDKANRCGERAVRPVELRGMIGLKAGGTIV